MVDDREYGRSIAQIQARLAADPAAYETIDRCASELSNLGTHLTSEIEAAFGAAFSAAETAA